MLKSIPETVSNWADLVSEKNPMKQTKLYSKDCVLLATFQTLFLGHDGVTEYMISFLNKDRIQCSIIENYTHYDVTKSFHVSSGLYEFTYFENNNKKIVKARYTFVIKNNLIISHHSSVQPS